MSARPVELELKYRVVAPETGARLLAADALGAYRASGPPRTTQNEDHYVDTPDAALARAGFAARFRQAGGSTLISLKSLQRSRGALHRRDELEGPADRGLAPMDWPASPARSLVLELCGDAPLVELVTVRQLRRKRRFVTDGSEVELSLDDADVVDRGRIADRFTELEVELLAGDPAPLEALGPVLEAEPGLRPSTASKLEAALVAAGIPLAVPVAAAVAVETGGTEAGSGGGDVLAEPGGGATAGIPTGADRETAHLASSSAAPEALDAPSDDGTPAGGGDGADTEAEAAGRAKRPSPMEDVEAGPAPVSRTVRRRRAKRARATVAVAVGDPAAGERAAGEPDVGEPDVGVGIVPEPVESGAPAIAIGKSPGVRADDTLAEAGRRVLRFHLARMLAKEAGTRSGRDSEDLHGMRVATRRMRAAWRVFGSAYRPARTHRYRRDLREVAARLGAVRDLDVLLDGLDDYRSGLPSESERQAIQPLVDAWHGRRDEARDALLVTLDSAAYRRFVDEYREFVLADGLGVMAVAPTEPHRVRDTMPSRIWAAYERVRAYEPVLRWADVETLHDLRIAAKWLRYTIEFVREPLGPEATPLIDRVVALQDHLGWLHDADVAAGLARSYLVEHAADLDDRQTAAIARYLMDRERERARLRRTIGLPWRRVAGIAFRRSLARIVADL